MARDERTAQTAFPVVGFELWCGDYRQREPVATRKPGRPPGVPNGGVRGQNLVAMTDDVLQVLTEQSADNYERAVTMAHLQDVLERQWGRTPVGALLVQVMKGMLRTHKVRGGWPGDHPFVKPAADGGRGAMFWLRQKISTAAPSTTAPDMEIDA